ncbi:MAG: tRNA pseudouridine(38-40) synthase TruA [Candidatus Planktophila sp.]|nr:tRNA pseudouridine(38-40) synthase TruA [Candidatus Planktophila sp.]
MSEPTLYPESGFLRIRIDLAYDGTNYAGWAKQPDQRTIQEEIETALAKITQSPIETIVAGRTDAGVHASGQVVHFDVPENSEIKELLFKLNRMLDDDIRVLKVTVMDKGFHARFSATRRYYTYKILDGNQVVSPLHRVDVAPWYRTLNLDLLNSASALLIGEHDFAAFCKFREGASTVRNLIRFNWIRDDEGYLIAEIAADAFCYSMVRNLVGAVVCVAEGRNNLDWISAMLANKERVPDSLVFVARGLTLSFVEYNGEMVYG